MGELLEVVLERFLGTKEIGLEEQFVHSKATLLVKEWSFLVDK